MPAAARILFSRSALLLLVFFTAELFDLL